VVFPLSLRICLPALNNNLVNLVKTTTQAYAIAVPELLYESVSIWSDYPSAQNPTMMLLFFAYIGLVGILVMGMNSWERRMKIPGYGST
jgi:polar amino acid transport system permease protein